MIAKTILDLIGNTPLLKISEQTHGIPRVSLYVKLELFNPWGSVKDRSAWGILKHHLDELPQKTVIESSSGNMAKALHMIALLHGSKLRTITNRIKVSEVKDILTLLGIDIQELPGKSDCFDPNDPNDPFFYIQKELTERESSYLYSDQYRNSANRDIHYETTGQEILNDLGKVDYFFGGLGTTGSTLGIAQRLKESNPEMKTIGIVAKKDDYIPGIRNSDEVLEVGLFQPSFYDELLEVSSHEALEAMMTLVKHEGLLAGPTTGASFHAVLSYLRNHKESFDHDKTAVFIACDRIEWYLSYIKERKPEWFGKTKRFSWKEHAKPLPERIIAITNVSSWIDTHHPLIIDTRQPISYKLGHIPNSLNLPMNTLDDMLSVTNPFCVSHPLLFVCPIGETSILLASYLHKENHLNAYSLEGGITAWKDHGLPLERDL